MNIGTRNERQGIQPTISHSKVTVIAEDELLEDGPCDDELEEAFACLRQRDAELKRTRDALAGLYGLIKLIYVGTDPADEIRRVLATNHRARAAAEVLGADYLDNAAF